MVKNEMHDDVGAREVWFWVWANKPEGRYNETTERVLRDWQDVDEDILKKIEDLLNQLSPKQILHGLKIVEGRKISRRKGGRPSKVKKITKELKDRGKNLINLVEEDKIPEDFAIKKYKKELSILNEVSSPTKNKILENVHNLGSFKQQLGDLEND